MMPQPVRDRRCGWPAAVPPRVPLSRGLPARRTPGSSARRWLPLVLLGGITDATSMDLAMREGFEFVAMARALLREPDLVNRIAADAATPSLCIHCNRCMPTNFVGTHCPVVADGSSGDDLEHAAAIPRSTTRQLVRALDQGRPPAASSSRRTHPVPSASRRSRGRTRSPCHDPRGGPAPSSAGGRAQAYPAGCPRSRCGRSRRPPPGSASPRSWSACSGCSGCRATGSPRPPAMLIHEVRLRAARGGHELEALVHRRVHAMTVGDAAEQHHRQADRLRRSGWREGCEAGRRRRCGYSRMNPMRPLGRPQSATTGSDEVRTLADDHLDRRPPASAEQEHRVEQRAAGRHIRRHGRFGGEKMKLSIWNTSHRNPARRERYVSCGSWLSAAGGRPPSRITRHGSCRGTL